MAKFYPFGGQTYYLGSSCGSTDTSILLSSFTEPVTGTPYTMALLNTDIVFATISPKSSQSEFISFTGITQNVDGSALLTGVTRGLAKKYPLTEDAAYKLPHSGQSIFIISNPPQLYQEYVSIANDQTVGGVKTFSSSPVVPTGGAGTQAANNQDIANAISGTVGTASTTQSGTVKISTAAASPTDPIAVGTNDTRVPTQGENDALVGNNTSIAVGTGNKFVTQTGYQNHAETYATSTGSSNAYVLTLSPVPTALVAGQEFEFKANFANTSAPTLNVNSLGAISIKKGNGTTDLASGDIASGQVVKVKYDGTNFQMISPVGNVFAYKNGAGTYATTSGTQTVTHSLGTIPKRILIYATCGNASATVQGVGSSSGSWDANGQSFSAVVINSGGSNTANSGISGSVYASGNNGVSTTIFAGAINNVTSSSFDIVWTATNAGLTAVFFNWSVEG